MNTALNLSSQERYDQGQEYFNTIVHFLESEECHSMKLSGLEQELEKKGRELMRILLQEYLNKLSPNICEQPVLGSDEYWNFHEACEYKQNHQNRYADGEVPPTKHPQFSSKRCHLKVIKGGKM